MNEQKDTRRGLGGWGHCGLESELLRSKLSQQCPLF